MQYVRALRESGCKWFLYENNFSIHKDIKAAITEELGVESICINSALVSAQNRKRMYWSNILNVNQPEDKGILLRDILESGETGREKSYCITATYYKMANNLESQYGEEQNRQKVFEKIPQCINIHPSGNGMNGDVITTDRKSSCLTTNKGEGPKIFEPVAVALRTYPRQPNGEARVKRPEVRNDEKANCITSVQSDSMVCEPVRIGEYGKGGQGQRIYSVIGKTITLTTNSGGKGGTTGLYKIDLPDGDYIIRKLTPLEAERLQTLPDDFTLWGDYGGTIKQVANTNRYKCIGNGWTVDVIAHILQGLKI